MLAGQAFTRNAGGAIREIRTVRSGSYDVATGTFTGPPSVTQSFDYDANGRLVAEVRSQGREVLATTYGYDAVGNRVSKTVTGPAGTEITSYSHTAADKLALETVSLAAGGSRATTYSWDGNGNLASKVEIGRATLYRFDAQNRLIDIREAATEAQARLASPKVRYAYDASGNRVSKWTAQRTDYLIDATYAHPQVLAEAVAETTSAIYVRAAHLERQTSQGPGGTSDLLPLHGHLGTSLGAVDIYGNVVEQVDHDAFGNLVAGSAFRQTHLYVGEYWDQDAELLYLRARWYDPRVGRFISPDPFEGLQGDPRSHNRYVYAQADPVHHLDRSGLMSLPETGIVLNNISMAYTAASIAFDLATGNYVGAAEDIATDLVCAKFGKTLCQKAGQQLKVFCNAIRCKNVLPHIDLGSVPSGASLSKNLELIGIKKPNGTQAHHIVGAVTDWGKATRDRLSQFNISVNSPANGVFLPGCGPTTNVIGMIHCGKHTEAYEREVFNRIQHLQKREDVISALDDIRRELLSNNFVVLNIRALQ